MKDIYNILVPENDYNLGCRILILDVKVISYHHHTKKKWWHEY